MNRDDAQRLLDTGMLVSQVDAAALLGITKSTLSWRGRKEYLPQPLGGIGKSLIYWLPDVTDEALRRMHKMKSGPIVADVAEKDMILLCGRYRCEVRLSLVDCPAPAQVGWVLLSGWWFCPDCIIAIRGQR